MNKIKMIERIGSEAVRRLRSTKLTSGKTFMITSKNLPLKHTYLEFPDRSIKIVTLAANQNDFVVLDILNDFEADKLRESYGLS